ncbi:MULTISPECIES: hypothetical protein [unclassified Modicisalibacter]|uniref:hypothetical protein n=1 Tax=unclassified Modicisalibacter TaxID=2679913 RepID=UPI001CCC1AB9|nr:MULTISPECIES: hypothetical protein [unclassified Modicisalibacter]MBZ9560294.1 hypothetical protein [Modicisalibacter sp. R2A 31.J]MBZ9576203.1 hypothetical protein [Modicisalibacter sp. MOD 31.J]
MALGAAVVSLLIAFAPGWLWMLSLAALVTGLAVEWRGETPIQLRWVPGAAPGWQRRRDGEWRSASVDGFYLGPWLAGLRIDGQCRWVWPDSAGPRQRWHLRRLLLWRGEAGA